MSRDRIEWPDWVVAVADVCLRAAVKEALHAEDAAIDAGVDPEAALAPAPPRDPCLKAYRAGHATLAAVREGKVVGSVACRKATVAARKFNTAAECAKPTAARQK